MHLDRLFEFLRFPSVSTDPARKADVAACAEWLAGQLADIGLKVEVHPTGGHPIVVARNAATLGIGAAQVNRRVAVDLALSQAGERARGAVMASDAYFPFAEGIAAAAAAGVTAIVQPGGSRRDAAAIEIADRHGMSMVFTGRRHYRR